MSATIARLATASPPPASDRAAWAAHAALLRYLDLLDRIAHEPEGSPLWKSFSEQVEGARRIAVRACDNFVGTV